MGLKRHNYILKDVGHILRTNLLNCFLSLTIFYEASEENHYSKPKQYLVNYIQTLYIL